MEPTLIKYLPVGTIEHVNIANIQNTINTRQCKVSHLVVVQPSDSLTSAYPQLSSSPFSFNHGAKATRPKNKPIYIKPI
jgi:cAMP phosphodiesterase